MLDTIDGYILLMDEIRTLAKEDPINYKATCRDLCRNDLFFLLIFGLNCDFMLNKAHPQWLLDRCKEVQESPNDHLDLWAREHFKSTIITFGKTIQDILASHGDDPLKSWKGIEVTFGIFSFNRPIAKKFLSQIMTELATNEFLKDIFPDVLWREPEKQAASWSLDNGIIVKRKSNPKEATVEAWGLVDGQPTSKHFYVCLYDDIVTLDHLFSVDLILKTTAAWEMSINLGSEGGARRYIGTRYVPQDTYQVMMERGIVKPRIYPCTDDGTETGNPVLMTKQEIEMKKMAMKLNFPAQMLMNPLSDALRKFQDEWIQHYDIRDVISWKGYNIYIIVDPANEKKEKKEKLDKKKAGQADPDYTAMMVVALGSDNNYYICDIVRDRLDPAERVNTLIKLHKRWNIKSGRPPKVICEQYGMMTDAFYLVQKQKEINYRFPVIKVGGQMSKRDRIERLIPIFKDLRVYLPKYINYVTIQKEVVELVQQFIDDEYSIFPRKGSNSHDDMLDALSRIMDDDPTSDADNPTPIAMFPKLIKKDLDEGYREEGISDEGKDFYDSI